MNGSVRRVLLPAVVLLGLAVLAPATARAAKWSVHIHGHLPAHRAKFIHPGCHAHGHCYHPHWYSHYYAPPAVCHAPPAVCHAPPAVYVYRAAVVVRRPAIGFRFGPVPPPGSAPPPRRVVHYYVW